jgi:hypothetical protein
MFKSLVLFSLFNFTQFDDNYASSCTSKDAIASNVELKVSPTTNLHVGQKYTLTSDFDLSETIKSGQAKYVGKLNGFTVLNDKYDLCRDIVDDCPLNMGHNTIFDTDTIPDFVPTGNFDLTVKWLTDDNREILCADYHFVISKEQNLRGSNINQEENDL